MFVYFSGNAILFFNILFGKERLVIITYTEQGEISLAVPQGLKLKQKRE